MQCPEAVEQADPRPLARRRRGPHMARPAPAPRLPAQPPTPPPPEARGPCPVTAPHTRPRLPLTAHPCWRWRQLRRPTGRPWREHAGLGACKGGGTAPQPQSQSNSDSDQPLGSATRISESLFDLNRTRNLNRKRTGACWPGVVSLTTCLVSAALTAGQGLLAWCRVRPRQARP